MTEVPEHLLRRAQQARARALGEEADALPEHLQAAVRDNRNVPEHLLRRVAERKAALEATAVTRESVPEPTTIEVPIGMTAENASAVLRDFNEGRLIKVPNGMDTLLAEEVLLQFYTDTQAHQE